MKKFSTALIAFIIICFSHGLKAQSTMLVNDTNINFLENGEYISVDFRYRFKKLRLLIDYGQSSGNLKRRTAMDEYGKPLKFYSKLHAFNVLSDNGWVYIDKYAYILGRDSITSNYLFKKLN